MRLREELEEYKRREEESKALIPLQIKEAVEQTTREIEAKIEERRRVDEQLEREREQRAMQLAIARENKRHLNAKLLEQQKRAAEYAEESSDDYDIQPVPQPQQAKAAVPQFDRSVKPQTLSYNQQQRPQTPPQASANSYALQKQRDFSPIRGSVVSSIRFQLKLDLRQYNYVQN